MSAVAIRPERLGDEDAIRCIVAAAFPEPAKAKLVDALRKAGALTVSLVAEQDSAIVGHVAFSPVTIASNPKRIDVLGLGAIAVTPVRQKQGIGKALIRAGLDAVKKTGASAVILLGSVDYYSRSGFESAAARGLTWGDGAQDAHLQVVALVSGALDGVAGAVRNHAAFDSL